VTTSTGAHPAQLVNLRSFVSGLAHPDPLIEMEGVFVAGAIT
jgi:hypothetical protein